MGTTVAPFWTDQSITQHRGPLHVRVGHGPRRRGAGAGRPGSVRAECPGRRALEVAARVDRLHAHGVACPPGSLAADFRHQRFAPFAISASGAEQDFAAVSLPFACR